MTLKLRRKKLLVMVTGMMVYILYRRSGGSSGSAPQVPADEDSGSCRLAASLNISSPRIIFGRHQSLACRKLCKDDLIGASFPPEENVCKSFTSYEICQLQGGRRGSIVCQGAEQCSRGSLGLAVLDSPTAQQLQWEQFATPASLRQYLNSLVDLSNSRDHSGLVYIRCQLTEPSGGQALQLLTLPPKFSKLSPQSSQLFSGKRRPSVSIIITGGASRSEFYSRMPRSLAHFWSLNINHTSHAEVLDYRLLQSLGSQHGENLRSLLTGTMGDRTNLPGLLKHFMASGYRTLFLDLAGLQSADDISHILGVRWQHDSGWVGLADAGIEGLGPTSPLRHAPHRFPGPCGKLYQLERIVEYLELYQLQLEEEKRPYISLLLARDVHQVDAVLANYLHQTGRLRDTLTLVTSIGPGSGKEEEEMPLFIRAPQRAKELLDESDWQNLVQNQDRLVSLQDLHFALRSIAAPEVLVLDPSVTKESRKKDRGLLDEAPLSRICAELPRTGFECICRPEEAAPVYDDQTLVALGKAVMELAVLNSSATCRQASNNLQSFKLKSSRQLQHKGDDAFSKLVLELSSEGQMAEAVIRLNKRSGGMQVAWRGNGSDCRHAPENREQYLQRTNLDSQVVVMEPLYGDCCHLRESSRAALTILHILNFCPHQLVVELEFHSDPLTAFRLVAGNVSHLVAPDTATIINLLLARGEQLPVWHFTLHSVAVL